MILSMHFFAAAVALSVLPIAIIFKISMDRLKENPEERFSIQQKFFIWVFISEIIPIILVVFGFVNLAPAETINDMLVPAIIIVAITLFGVVFIFLQLLVDLPADMKYMMTIFTLFGISLNFSMKIISKVAFFLILPQLFKTY